MTAWLLIAEIKDNGRLKQELELCPTDEALQAAQLRLVETYPDRHRQLALPAFIFHDELMVQEKQKQAPGVSSENGPPGENQEMRE